MFGPLTDEPRFIPPPVSPPSPVAIEEPPELKAELYTVTAYTAGPESTGKSPGDEGYGTTASGERVKDGITAACSEDIPFGTHIEIEGVGERTCTDRGGAITNNHVDIYVESLDDAIEFGRQTLKVRIYK